jgi:hypothetical protein
MAESFPLPKITQPTQHRLRQKVAQFNYFITTPDMGYLSFFPATPGLLALFSTHRMSRE